MEQGGGINIIIVSPAEIASLNETYRGKEGPTDILTFPYRDSVNKATDIAGEIYLCLEKIQYYAEERGTSYEEQLKYIIVHGLVHMMGYDHETEKESKEMEKIEKRILALLGEEK
jgi:probable rRNA maturation factor